MNIAPFKYLSYSLALFFSMIIFSCDMQDSPPSDSVQDALDQAKQLVSTHPDSAKLIYVSLLKTTDNKRISWQANLGLGILFRKTNQVDSALFQLNIAEEAMLINTDPRDQALLYEELSQIHLNSRNISEATAYDSMANAIYVIHNDTLGIIRTLTTQSELLNVQGNYADGFEYLLKAHDLASSADHFEHVANIYNRIGAQLCDRGLHEDGVNYYNKAIDIYAANGDQSGLARIYANLGVSFFKLEQHEAALSAYSQSLDAAIAQNELETMAQNYFNMGNVLKEMDRLDEARQAYHQSLQICSDHSIFGGIIFNYINLASFESSLKRYDSALSYALKAKERIGQKEMPYELANTYGNIYEAYDGLGDIENAYKYYQLAHTINDSLNSVSKHNQIVEMKTKYETEVKENEITQLEQAAKRQAMELRATITTSLGIIVILLSLVIILYLRNQLAKKKLSMTQFQHEITALQLEKNESELKSYLHKTSQMSELIQGLQSKLAEMTKDKTDTNAEVTTLIDSYLRSENIFTWREFEAKFDNLHPAFRNNLHGEHPQLSPIEIRICLLLRLNTSTKEIAYITKRSVRTIETARFRIRKKIGLQASDNLNNFLYTFKSHPPAGSTQILS